MTKDEMRAMVAEACGWRISYAHCDNGKYVCDPRSKIALSVSFVPDYPNDLNACAEFRNHMNLIEYAHFNEIIQEFEPRSEDGYRAIDTPATVRCNAFLRVKGLWKD